MRILWLKTELLHPIDKGGKIRTYQMLKELKKEHTITYLTLDDGSAGARSRESALEYCQHLITVPQHQTEKFSAGFYVDLGTNLFSKLPYAIDKYKSEQMTKEIAKRFGGDKYDLMVCDFLAPAVNIPARLQCPVVLFEHNVEASIWKRHYEVQNNPIKKFYLWHQWWKMRRFERENCRRFDCVVTVSGEDAQQVRQDYGAQHVYDVPTGVDTTYFSVRDSGTENKNNLVFTGSMDWLPNIDSIRFFAQSILPIIKETVPEVTLTVVGRNPSPELLKLADLDRSIIVTGRVEDVRPYIESAAIYVVPLRIGGGTRLKIYESMAMGKPVVSTTIGAEGLPVTAGKDILIADTAADFAASIIYLLQNPKISREIAATAEAKVREKFGWPTVAKRFSEICEKTVARKTQPV